MICQKCGVGHMVDDSHHDIRVFKCCICGDRIYPDHPKRSGALVCSRCDGDMDEKNALSLCKGCLSLLNIQAERLKGRNYGKTVCICGTTFTKTSPTQLFHSRECRNRAMTVQAELKSCTDRRQLLVGDEQESRRGFIPRLWPSKRANTSGQHP